MKTKDIIVSAWMLLTALTVQAQGSGDLKIHIQGKVFGGARQANVGGHTFVDIGADNHDVVISAVYGGNDIAGTIGPGSSSMPITPEVNTINATYNAFIRTNREKTTTTESVTTQDHNIFIGQLFGGGYGNYEYIEKKVNGKTKYDVVIHGTNDPLHPEKRVYVARDIDSKPNLAKTYLELKGGTFGYAYGGGDSVTVTSNTDICIKNTSIPWKMAGDNAGDPDDDAISDAELQAMGINTMPEYFDQTGTYHFSRVFGGNNRAEMSIRPSWHLMDGSIQNLYSGGNEGMMTHIRGLLLNIEETSNIVVTNVYGGCRKADVRPLDGLNGDANEEDIQLFDASGNQMYNFPTGLAARVLVKGGTITNVYGGNDVTGRVYGGNAVGVYTSIIGNIFGGGNGNYPYTDNEYLKKDAHYGDFYYNPTEVLSEAGVTAETGFESVTALNLLRPNAEQVSVYVRGVAGTPTIIGGAIYCGGNSATLKKKKRNPLMELVIGSHVIAENVFLGNNGADMIKYEDDTDVLKLYAQDVADPKGVGAAKKFNSMDLTNTAVFSKYMDGCALDLPVSVDFEDNYVPYSTYFGSFFCGGNVGSMTMDEKSTITFDEPVIVYSKVVGGCNDAYVEAHAGYNAAYQGGIIGSEDQRPATLGGAPRFTKDGKIQDRLVLNFKGLKIMPLRRPKAGVDYTGENYDDDVNKTPSIASHIPLVWNTIKLGERQTVDGKQVPVPVAWNNNSWAEAKDGHSETYNSRVNRRFTDGNIYGGCCNSGVVNGNVVINIEKTIVDRAGEHGVFDILPTDDETGEDKLYNDSYVFANNNEESGLVSGVILGQQGMDVLGSALNVFGGGKGLKTEIWGSATINLKSGYVFQIFGGSEEGAIGKNSGVDQETGKYIYTYNPQYSTYVNLTGGNEFPGQSKVAYSVEDMVAAEALNSSTMAEAEFLYGGGFAGPIAGNTHINLDNGRIFNSFAGSCNADIQGHTETIIGANGFPYVRDYVYGGNDLGGKILANPGTGGNDCNFSSRIPTGHSGMVYSNDILTASAYIEYLQGRAEKIFGGCYGVYDYTNPLYGDYFYARGAEDTNETNIGTHRPGYSKPWLDHAFINFRPVANGDNAIHQIYGAGQGYFGEPEENTLQNSSYIYFDAENSPQFEGTEIFGAGECGGVGMHVDLDGEDADDPADDIHPDKASAIIDLVSGQVRAVYGGSYKEGITRRTVVNVPTGSSLIVNRIFGGAYGVQNDVACDVYEAIVNYKSEDASFVNFTDNTVTPAILYKPAIYGGNNSYRRTLYGKVNIEAPLEGGTHWTGLVNVYGAGYGENTWSQYTEVNLESNAQVQEVYGGGENGQVVNRESVAKWKLTQTDLFTDLEGYTDNGLADGTPANSNQLHTVDPTRPKYYNTNVHIKEGARVRRYCYGGGLGSGNIQHSGNVYGTTYIDLLGGTVDYDLYAAGTSGSVKDSLGVKAGFTVGEVDYPGFIASSTAYIEGGKVRNVYGGGWAGTVGHHNGTLANGKWDYLGAPYYGVDIPGETHVIIGKLDGTSFTNGIPTVERNAYGGGEGGPVWGTAHITLNNGYIGYRYNNGNYDPLIEDETVKDASGNLIPNKNLEESGCIFGGGYVDDSSVDNTEVKMYGGYVRNALFGGGELSAIGRGKINASGEDNSVRTLTGIYKAGKTRVELFGGHVLRNVFGGGRGYAAITIERPNILYSEGYVFGHTEVRIHGGEVGTADNLDKKNGNVFGGGDIGYVYSAYEGLGKNSYGDDENQLYVGIKDGARYDDNWEGYYYKYKVGTGSYTPGPTPADTDGNWVTDNGEFILTEDCKVLVEPYCKVKDSETGNVSFTITYKPGNLITTADIEYLKEYVEKHPVEKFPTVNVNFENIASAINSKGEVQSGKTFTLTLPFAPGEYVPTFALNTLDDRDNSKTDWDKLNADGIIIHNAVFAGGNTALSQSVHANGTSIYGNVTASIHDVYHRDLITIGTGHMGGLYGDGNLTFVDGYRGLNITNYGTDYYYLHNTKGAVLSFDQLDALLEREQGYYERRYKCVKECVDKDGTVYYDGTDPEHPNASTLTEDDIITLFKNDGTYTVPAGLFNSDGTINTGSGAYWVENGVCSIYAGRILNTIQRADFCGVFGSRMVMQGAEDRVPEVADHTNYTINRVREVSLNKKHSLCPNDVASPKEGQTLDQAEEEAEVFHGNYFGIYSIVNYLGALTSDFDFGDESGEGTNIDVGTGGVRTSDNKDKITYKPDYTDQTFYGWKKGHSTEQKRNNGNSHNKVALASGVYLELTTEKSTGKDLYEKDWGYITGVVELDLINVQTGMGGGFVYAKNVHGLRTKDTHAHVTLTALNAGAVTRKDFTYKDPDWDDPDDADDEPADYQREWQTSGNFVHSTQIIIDDCYNVSGKFMGSDRVPAHYWYIKGSVYVYDQYISAYTGVPSAYSETVNIPLTITAASNGRMKLLNIQPNRYAYLNTNGEPLGSEQKLEINGNTYTLNQPITWWEWNKLTASEKALFKEETMVSITKYKYSDDEDAEEFPAGQVMLPTDFTSKVQNLISTNKAHYKVDKDNNYVLDEHGNRIVQFWDVEKGYYVNADSVIRSSNNLSHEKGYILTYKVDNPPLWDTWFTEELDSYNNSSVSREKDQTDDALSHNGPTYRLIEEQEGQLLGQRSYKEGDLIPWSVYKVYHSIPSNQIPTNNPDDPNYDPDRVQAVFEENPDNPYDPDDPQQAQAKILKEQVTVTSDGETYHLYEGHVVSNADVTRFGLSSSSVENAYICTGTIQLSKSDFVYVNNRVSESEKTKYTKQVSDGIKAILTTITPARLTAIMDDSEITKFTDLLDSDISGLTLTQEDKTNLTILLAAKEGLKKNIEPAYYCISPGLYGGDYYVAGKNYRALDVWSSMSEEDHQFLFNYDALDVLIDSDYSGAEGKKYQYDASEATKAAAQENAAHYSLSTPLDYTATYNGEETNQVYNTVTLNPGVELTRENYEKLPNEQRHYAPISVTDDNVNKNIYVVHKEGLIIDNTPYAIGSIIAANDYNSSYSNYVTALKFTTAGTYYYCRESYKVNEKTEGQPVKAVANSIVTGMAGYDDDGNSVSISDSEYGSSDEVPIGLVISADGEGSGSSYKYGYKSLVNKQKNFIIHGKAPTETSTLYVSRFSDINDLSTEKIITVVYEYAYEESDEDGEHITPVSERHVLNIHITFKSGLPEVEDIKAPKIVMPSEHVGLRAPNAIPAEDVISGGWEMYEREVDAESRTNAIPFSPNDDPLYWYQDGYFVRYYVLTVAGGKSYSNYVPLSVANSHDLTKVMADTEHHYYVDNPNVKRDSKIYITHGTEGMNQLKDFYDLSVNGLSGHNALDNHVRAGRNLEFIMQTNVEQNGNWTSIAKAASDPCFEGVLHGDGHYISGLSESLFEKLCGEVYNLGVMGSFTGAGIVEKGDGYVENCWVKSDAESGWAEGVQAVFGKPERTPYVAVKAGTTLTKDKTYYTDSNGGGGFSATGEEVSDGSNYYMERSTIQLVNCYYPVGNEYLVTENADHGAATQMPVKSFYNGEVAYDLNGFYLYKRYRDHATPSGASTSYKYFTSDDQVTPLDATYGTTDITISSSGSTSWEKGYVEDRYADGDFRYANHEIPDYADARIYDPGDGGKQAFYPIWPDDYLFFGQMLTYDWDEANAHENVPSPIVKHLVNDTDGRLPDDKTNNRVYRAPAYYRNATMGVAHFNPNVNLVAKSKPANALDTNMKDAYPNMTAIDFAGHHDLSNGYQLGLVSTRFYPPLLDDDGLMSIFNRDETRNLLVYAPLREAASGYANQKTYDVLVSKDAKVNLFNSEPKFTDYYSRDEDYRCVAAAPTTTVFGHLVHYVAEGKGIATNDHLLVDKQDFNCPIPYTMDNGYRMWYQRVPENYVTPVWSGSKRTTKGWESVSLPFTAELVTTVNKGEITHFYSGSKTATNSDSKLGHEYWLREYRDISTITATAPDIPEGATEEEIAALNAEALAGARAEALFTYPNSDDDWEEKMSPSKVVKNSFLWDYYYNAPSGHNHLDANKDVYRTYYKPNGSGVVNSFENYTLLTRAVPYIIGFPGETFYEFDLSGVFDPTTTDTPNPDELPGQTITFASKSDGNVRIYVSDGEKTGVTHAVDGKKYTFRPSYLNEKLTAGKLTENETAYNVYTLSSDGSKYQLASADGAVSPVAFRPYFMTTSGTGARPVTRSIIFNNADTELKGVEEKGDPTDEATGTLNIYAKKHKIIVESALNYLTDVRIVNTAGITINTFSVEPGETVETRINNAGVYIVQTNDTRYTKKLAVR